LRGGDIASPIKEWPDESEALAQGVFESPNWIFKYRIIRLYGA
jgi:hypothetical protein